MKPYGREKNIKGSGSWKKDYHARPKKMYINWWEDLNNIISRKSMKQKIQKEIENIDKTA